MSTLITIGKRQLTPIDYQDERVITLAQIDTIHERATGGSGSPLASANQTGVA